jgi:hypothetical protein
MSWFFGRISRSSSATQEKNSILYSSPQNNDADFPIDGDIYIYLKQKIENTKNFSITSNPNFDFKIFLKDGGETIEIKPTLFLMKNKEYKIILSSKNSKNPPFSNLPFEINFKTGETIESALKQDSSLILKINKKIPVFSTDFDLSYIEEKGAFAVVINSSDCQKVKGEVLNYFRENGINPDEVKIIWYAGSGINTSCVPVK